MAEFSRSIGGWNAFFVLLLSITIYTHVLLVPVLLMKAGRDAWLALLIATAIMALWIWMFSVISKRVNGMSIPLWIQQRFGTGMRYLITVPVALCTFMMSAIAFKDTISWSTATYLQYTPPIMLVILLALVCYWACSLGVRNIAYVAGIIGPLVVFCGIFIMSANMPKKHYSMLLPILEHGIAPVWQAVWDVLGGLIQIFFILLIQPYLAPKVKVNFIRLFIFNLVIMVITMGPLTGAISAFGLQEAMSQRYPPFEQWRIVQIGKYIEHMDFLSIFQWLSGSFIRISLLSFFTMDLFMIQTLKRRRIFLAFLFLLLVIWLMLPVSDVAIFRLMTTYYSVLIFCILGGVTICLFLLSLFQRRLEEQS
ncbi:GerAB/ArcD/ProY family transporter [Alicyclobacillus fastidiosus]|uniref:GerAB/ArcD/ProY family transporter n=1 Tax=Alicyclobacillus fastidiosus TaxID=392011 RepID=A0ABV5AJM7_9BACL|nr:GerAB/ArcD/ProY family transporter [Alicyclobacillus fastidiosus]WEH08242.1 GerAB/ArcD/ProY family transporter [Alicyclobacillus fastidiosus]